MAREKWRRHPEMNPTLPAEKQICIEAIHFDMWESEKDKDDKSLPAFSVLWFRMGVLIKHSFS